MQSGSGMSRRKRLEERRERLREEAEARKAARRIVKGLCLWVSGAAMILAAMAGTAEMTYECVVTGFVALVARCTGWHKEMTPAARQRDRGRKENDCRPSL